MCHELLSRKDEGSRLRLWLEGIMENERTREFRFWCVNGEDEDMWVALGLICRRFAPLELREVEEDVRNLQQQQHLGSVCGFLVIDGKEDDLIPVDGAMAAMTSKYGCRWRQAATQLVVEKSDDWRSATTTYDWTTMLLARRRFGWCEGENGEDWWSRHNKGLRWVVARERRLNRDGLRFPWWCCCGVELASTEGFAIWILDAKVMKVQQKGENALVVARDALERTAAGEDGGDGAGWCGD
ncbi:hypothetical protein V8G54_028141 [Vigna mungo]|uniref:Uncharacterized protein n=1 Tax=Vigna mungo TaxID=3915 RepID=A0AAQ3MRU0_VIGMU